MWPYVLKPGKKKNLTLEDKQKIAMAPYEFAKRLVGVYYANIWEYRLGLPFSEFIDEVVKDVSPI